MPRGDKRKYTDKQKRQAEHIEEGYKARGVSSKEAAARAWATVNAIHGGGEKRGGSGYGKPENHEPMRKGGRKAGRARKSSARSRTSKRRSGATASRRGARSSGRSKSARKRTTRTRRTARTRRTRR